MQKSVSGLLGLLLAGCGYGNGPQATPFAMSPASSSGSPAVRGRNGGAIVIASDLISPTGITADERGNVYIADDQRRSVIKITALGKRETVGTGIMAFSIAADDRDNVFVSSCRGLGVGVVYKITPRGAMSTVSSDDSCFYGLAVDSKDNVYGADPVHNEVKKISPDGLVTIVGSGFDNPGGVAVDAAGNVYVADTLHDVVKKVAPNGSITTLGERLFRPKAIAVGEDGAVFVAERPYGRIARITSKGQTYFATGIDGVSAIAIDSVGYVYATDAVRDVALRYTPEDVVTSIGSGFSEPRGVAADDAGNVYVADTKNNAVKKISPDGTIAEIGSGFKTPIAVAVDEAGTVYVSDTGNDAVKKIAPDGTTTRLGSGYGKPYGIAVDGNGVVYVADFGANTVWRVAQDGTKLDLYEGDRMYHPSSVAVDLSGRVLAVAVYPQSGWSNGLVEYLRLGKSREVITNTYNKGIFDITVDAAGDIYAASTVPGKVNRFDPPFDGNVGGNIIPVGTKFTFPTGVAVAPSCPGYATRRCFIYVADSVSNKVFRVIPS